MLVECEYHGNQWQLIALERTFGGRNSCGPSEPGTFCSPAAGISTFKVAAILWLVEWNIQFFPVGHRMIRIHHILTHISTIYIYIYINLFIRSGASFQRFQSFVFFRLTRRCRRIGRILRAAVLPWLEIMRQLVYNRIIPSRNRQAEHISTHCSDMFRDLVGDFPMLNVHFCIFGRHPPVSLLAMCGSYINKGLFFANTIIMKRYIIW